MAHIMRTRADRNNNPAALTTGVAKQAGLQLGVDYVPGDPFPAPSTLVTARLLGDPVALTIRVIDAVGFYTKLGGLRWSYIGMMPWLWDAQNYEARRRIIGDMYARETGTELKHLFEEAPL